MDFDYTSYALFIIALLLTYVFEQDTTFDSYLPKNKMFYTLFFSIIAGILGGMIPYYNFNVTQNQILLIGLIIFRLMSILRAKSQEQINT